MRVLLVSHRFPPDNLAGVELYTANVADRLAAAGHAVEVLARRPTPGVKRASLVVETRASGVTVRRIVRQEVGPHGSGRPDPGADALSRRVVEEFRPEVVHVTHLMYHSPRLAERARSSGAGLVVSLLDFFGVCPRAHLRRADGAACEGPRGGAECAARCFAHRPWIERALWRRRAWRFERVLRAADRLLCPSRFVHDWFAPRMRDPRRLVTLPLGVNEEPAPGRASPPRAWTDGPFELAFVGALVPDKGCDVLVEALARARLDRARLRIIGQAPDAAFEASIRERAGRVPGLEVSFRPPFEAGALPRLLEGAHVVVVPSLVAETFSLVAREALACGIPVLASRRGALPEIVRDGVNGGLFDPGRPEELADGIRLLAQDRTRLGRLAQGATDTVVTRLDEHVEGLVGTYRDAIERRGRATVGGRVRALLAGWGAAPRAPL